MTLIDIPAEQTKTSSAEIDGISTSVQRVVVVGQGYVGLLVSMRAVDVGYDVVGYDVDQRKVDQLIGGESYIHDVTNADVGNALATGRFSPTQSTRDLANFDVAVITVPTPLKDGVPNMSYIESATRQVAAHLRPGCLVILESTTYPGTTESFVAPILEEVSGLRSGTDFHLGFSPERIDPGNQKWTFQNTPKVISGVNSESLAAVKRFYDTLVSQTIPTKGTKEAELAKLLENTFRHMNIALVNEISISARALGIDIRDAISAASSKPFGFMPFFPGPGVGGHCLPVDPTYLAWQFERELGHESHFVKLANRINEGMPAEVVRRVQLGLNERGKPVKGSEVLVIGLAYKANSNDIRETPTVGIIDGLRELGARVAVHDEWVAEFSCLSADIRRASMSDKELQRSDAVIVVTDHDDLDADLIVRHADYVFDTRGCLTGTNVEQL